jgi:metallophosphoesterase (TIGR03767 family)
MRLPPRVLPLAVLAAVALAPAPASAATTLQQTIAPDAGSGYRGLHRAPGEPYVVRRGAGAPVHAARTRSRRSLAFFAQLTDPQIADEMSPARVDFADPAGGEVSAAWRPQEALGLDVFDRTVHAVNANRTSPVAQSNGRRARLQLALTTGDLTDNQQLNETRWYRTVLDGGRVDPFSGKPISASNACPGATSDAVSRLDADVAARRYTGVQDYEDYATATADRKNGFWDPDTAPAGGAFASFPRYPGLMDAAQRPFTAEGLKVPWYDARGNHDGLVQGNAPASEPLFRSIAVGCLKVFPGPGFDPAPFAGASASQLFRSFGDPAFITQLLAGARQVAPDPDRRFVGKAEFRRLLRTGDHAHGLGYTDRSQLRASKGTASYYAFTRGSLRFIALDTVAEGGNQSGNLDDPQYRWLAGELQAARRADQLVIVYGHHTMATMDNVLPDEDAKPCTTADEPGCDRDPRLSTPIHRGLAGPQSVRALLDGTPNVVAYVAGHTHENKVDFFAAGGGHGFWQINTASHIDWPEQSREIEVMDNRDGTLSLFGTLLDTAAPVRAPASGFTTAKLASLARTLAWNDPQRSTSSGNGGSAGDTGRGTRVDRNVELLLRDPRRVAGVQARERAARQEGTARCSSAGARAHIAC